jgi:hypothetical protein
MGIQTNQAGWPMAEKYLVPAGKLRSRFFVKRTGTYVYLRLSKSSVKHFGLSPDKVYGVCFNGNTTTLDPNTLVRPTDVNALVKNMDEEAEWNRMFGYNDD